MFGMNEPEPVEPDSPEYTNPVASGTEDIFGGGGFGGDFGEPVDDGGPENGQHGGQGLFGENF